MIAVPAYFIYHFFIKTAPVEYRDGKVIYNEVSYKECWYEDVDPEYKTDKFLGNFKQNGKLSDQVFTVKNDPENNLLIFKGFLDQDLYVREDYFEQHVAAKHPQPRPT